MYPLFTTISDDNRMGVWHTPRMDIFGFCGDGARPVSTGSNLELKI